MPLKLSKSVLGIISAVVVLVLVVILVFQIPGAPAAPVSPPPAGINITPEVEQKLGTGSAVLTAVGKAEAGVLREITVSIYYIGSRSAQDPCRDVGLSLKACERTMAEGTKCSSVEFTCSSRKIGELQDQAVLSLSANADKSLVVSLGKYGTYTDVVVR